MNKANGHQYVGSSVDVQKRWREHHNALRAGEHRNPHLQAAWDKYGKDAFYLMLLEAVADPQFLALVEQRHLGILDPEYNIATVAGSTLGVRPSDEARRRMSEARRGKSLTEEIRCKMSVAQRGEKNHQYGKPKTEAARRKISEALRGRPGKPQTDETRRKISEALRGKPSPLRGRPGKKHTEEARRKMSVAQRGEKNHWHGKRHTDETRYKISEAQRHVWARRKGAVLEIESSGPVAGKEV